MRGQALLMTALLLPAFLTLSFGVIEVGNVYAQSLALARAADSAARVLADEATGADLALPSPPDWMRREAARLVGEALQGRVAVDGVGVSWGSAPRVVNDPGSGVRLDVPLPQYGTGSTQLRWGDPHGFSYQVPEYRTDWRSQGFQPGVSYGESATYPGWRWANLTNWHWYADNSTWSWGEQGVGGFGYGYGVVWMCLKFCIPVYAGLVKVVGTSNINYVYDAPAYDVGRWMGGNYEGAWIPADWTSWWTRRTSTDAFTHWDRWLAEAGWRWTSGTSQANPGSAQVGSYAVYQGDMTQQATAYPTDPRTVRRVIVVSATGRLRAVTPVVGVLFADRAVSRTAVRDVAKRM